MISLRILSTLYYHEDDNLSDVLERLDEVVSKLDLPSPETSVKSKASKMSALYRKTVKWGKLTKIECDHLLKCFSDSVKKFSTQHCTQLKELPLFTTLFFTLVILSDYDRVFVVDCRNDMVLDGIEALSSGLKVAILEYNQAHVEIYHYLEFF